MNTATQNNTTNFSIYGLGKHKNGAFFSYEALENCRLIAVYEDSAIFVYSVPNVFSDSEFEQWAKTVFSDSNITFNWGK